MQTMTEAAQGAADAATTAAASGDAVSGMMIMLLVPALYFLPTLVAFARGHHNKAQITLLNLFLGWTFLGWIGAIIWSVGVVKRPVAA